MTEHVVSRSAESRATAAFLAAAAERPAGLLIEGEAGIGKTTLWLAGIAQARDNGFQVLLARAGQAESVMAYAAVADLVRDVDAAVLADLPDLQRLALDRVLLRSGGEGPETDQRVTAAAFVAVVERLSARQPVLVAIDDVQWLDSSSQAVIAFAAKRFSGRVGLLVTERTGSDAGSGALWLQLADPDGVERIRMSPLTLGALDSLIAARLGKSLPRPTMVRIAEMSGGNPFYALELVRAMDGASKNLGKLPGSLSDLVRMRIGSLAGDAQDVLLMAACLSEPTVDVLVSATGATVDLVVDILDASEAGGIVAIEGNRVRFTHPLLARGVYTEASPASRRRMHRLLADVVTQPELRARHLALATVSSDPRTLEALDAAAESARERGAPAAAAELLDLAIRLGGDTPARRMKSASHHIRAGDTGLASEVIRPAIDQLPPGPKRAEALVVRATILLNSEGFPPAVELLKLALDDARDNAVIRVPVRLLLSFALANLAQFGDALHHAEQARIEAEPIPVPSLVSASLANWVFVSFICGRDFDRDTMKRALELEDLTTDFPISFRASALNALLLMWVADLDAAATQMDAVRERLVERGEDTELLFVSMNSALLNALQGKYAAASADAADTFDRVERLGATDYLRSVGLTMRGGMAVLQGREAEARADLYPAIEAGMRSQALTLPLAMSLLGELEMALGNYDQVLTILAPALAAFDFVPNTEMYSSGHLPNAIEALVLVGRVDEAERYIDELERNGRERDRGWMLAKAARGRSLLLAARGDIDGAVREIERSLTEYERVPIPVERARALLYLGQLRRRQRQKQSAATTLTAALNIYEDLGSPLWAQRARAELARVNVGPSQAEGLTPAEQRVADLAASGMTNRDIATALFVSAKTVEANLTQIYRKLGIRSRAELGRIIGQQS